MAVPWQLSFGRLYVCYFVFPGMAFAPDPPFPVGLRPPSFNEFTDMTRSEHPGVLFLMSSKRRRRAVQGDKAISQI